MKASLVELKNDLLLCHQEHLFQDPVNPSQPLSEALQSELLEELHALSYPGGAAGYVQTAQQLLGTLPSPPPKLKTVPKEADDAPERTIVDVSLPSRDVMFNFPVITDPHYNNYPARGSADDKVYTFPPELFAKLPEAARSHHKDSPLLAVEEYGLQLMQDTIFVLVAGGLGERLGYKGIKVSLPCDTAGQVCFLEHYISYLATAGRAAAKQNKKPLNPFVIMTSDDTHLMTLQLLQKHKCFGYDPERIILMRQETVPCLTDQQAHIAVKYEYSGEGANKKVSKVILPRKPHGHGDVHQLLYQLTEDSALTAKVALKNTEQGGELVLSSGIHQRDAKGARLIDKWGQEGFRYVVFIQDTNAMAMPTIPYSLAAMEVAQLKMILTCMPRREAEAVGIFCRQVFRATGDKYDKKKHPTDLTRVANIEYNIFSGVYARVFEGKPKPQPDAEGNSPFPGSINTLLITLDSYAAALHKHHGKVPEFINPKYNPPDANGVQTFKSPARVESLMQDIALVLSDMFAEQAGGDAKAVESKIGCTVFGRETYEPVKNFLDDGLKNEHTVEPLPVRAPTSVHKAKITSKVGACCGSTCEEAFLNFSRNCFLNSYRDCVKVTDGPVAGRTKAVEDASKAGFITYERDVTPTTVIVNTPSGNTLPVNLFPVISYDAAFAHSLNALELHKKDASGSDKIKLSTRSVLVIHGKVILHSLDLDGALVITNPDPNKTVVVEALTVRNKGWEAVPLELLPAAEQPALTEVDRMRGYKFVKHETAAYTAEGNADGKEYKLTGKL